MHIIRESVINNHTTSAESNAWNGIKNSKQIFIQLMKSSIPVAYVDITYDFLKNFMPFGVFLNHNQGQTPGNKSLGSSYSRCTKVGTEMVTIVSINKFDCKNFIICLILFFLLNSINRLQKILILR